MSLLLNWKKYNNRNYESKAFLFVAWWLIHEGNTWILSSSKEWKLRFLILELHVVMSEAKFGKALYVYEQIYRHIFL